MGQIMITGTLVKINRTPEEKPDTQEYLSEEVPVFGNQVMDSGWEFKILNRKKFKSKVQAMVAFSKVIDTPAIKDKKSEYGMMLHAQPEVESAPNVTLVSVGNGENIETLQISNPFWRGVAGVRRNVSHRGFDAEPSLAMQSQLFAMLDSTAGDSQWMQSFQLKDHQQSMMYGWQDENFDKVNNMSPGEMQKMFVNVLNVARLPRIRLDFKAKGNACMFAITRPNGKTLNIESQDGKEDGDSWGWLNKAGEERFERIGVINDGYRLRISDMRLVMIMSWAMNAHTLLHEIAHYITFVSPTSYRLNRGDYKLSYVEYEEIFAGHGAAYMAVFARLLIDFFYVEENYLYDNLRESGLKWFPIKSVRARDINDGITKYCKKFEE